MTTLPNDILNIIYDFTCINDHENLKIGLRISDENIVERIKQYGLPLTEILHIVAKRSIELNRILKYKSNISMHLWNLLSKSDIISYTLSRHPDYMFVSVRKKSHQLLCISNCCYEFKMLFKTFGYVLQPASPLVRCCFGVKIDSVNAKNIISELQHISIYYGVFTCFRDDQHISFP